MPQIGYFLVALQPIIFSSPAMSSSSSKAADPGFQAFAHLLDARLLRALARRGFGTPTPVQRESIEHSLGGEGRDILARARTGSGKTLAYGLPVIQKILMAKERTPRSSPSYAGTRALILVPTKELSEQIVRQLLEVLEFCRDEVSVANVARGVSTSVQKLLLSEKPDIVVATPSRALACLQSGVRRPAHRTAYSHAGPCRAGDTRVARARRGGPDPLVRPR